MPPLERRSAVRRHSALAAAFAAVALLAAAAAPAGALDQRLKWKKEWGPMVPHKKFSKDCSLCHVAKRWDALRSDFAFDHKKETGYPLLGAHAQAACLRCHNDRGPVKAYLSRGCGGCHVDPHKATLGLDCERCHDQTAWVRPGRQGLKIAEHARTRFPLTGMHAVIDCRQCHLGADQGDFRAMNTDCWSCHRQQYAAAPNHVAKNYNQNCATCHQTSAWPGASFNHAFLGANPVCVTCHATDFQSAPNHVAQSFSSACLTCHTGTVTWLGAGFNHSVLGANPVCINCHAANFAAANTTPASKHAANGFPQTCQNCHNTTLFGPGTAMQHAFVAATACYTCHSADYTAAPNHVAQSFPTTCASCHSGTATWLGAVFDHTPLGANPVCWNCHQTEYAGAKTTPASNHPANGFPQTCQNCHTFAAWGPGTAMQHASVAATACYTCHAGDFAAAKSTPASNHATNSFPTTCANCHNTTAWGPGTAMVHTAAGVPNTCQTCHLADFNSASSPINHVGQGIFASACSTCHSGYVAWSGFTHNPSNCNSAPSAGSHHNATCVQCHSTPVYTTATCTACHSNRGNSCN